MPAEHVEQGAHGEKPGTLQVKPPTQDSTGRQRFDGLSQKAVGCVALGAVLVSHEQLVWPVSAPIR